MIIPFYIFAPLFIVAAIGVMFILSRMGWIHLARKYGTKEKFKGERLGSLLGSINGISYRNVAILYYNETELYFNSSILFRLFHSPFKIPIQKFHFTVRKGKYYYLELNDVSDMEFRLDRRQGQKIISFLEKNGMEKLIRYEN